MSFVVRPYPVIVQDVLTTLTKGVAAEAHDIDYDPDARPLVVPDILLTARPVRRVSVVRGFVETANSDEPVEALFSLNEYELISNSADPDVYDGIRFHPLAKRKPAPGTAVTINYYPRTTDPTVLTDLNVGSVARTIIEALSRELAGLYAQLGIAYDSAFLETAQGAALDHVVALLDYRRFRAGHAVGTVTFTRRAGGTGIISIPAGTPITDGADKVRYVTSERYDMQAGEGVARVRVQGALQSTPAVEAGKLAVVQRAIAGIETVTNEEATVLSTQDESDDALRARTRDALIAANKGTLEAMQYGLLALPDVAAVSIVEMPNGVAGELAVSVQLRQPPPSGTDLPQHVIDRINELRPAGVHVLSASAPVTALAVRVSLVLAGSSRPPAEIAAVKAEASRRLCDEVTRKGVGERVRVKPLVAALLADTRIADVTLAIGPRGQTPAASEDYQPDARSGTSLDVADVSFEPETFADPPPAVGQNVRVDVRAVIGATPVGGTALDAISAALTQRLKDYAVALRPGMTIDATAVLNALRDDTQYQIDPLKLSVTLTAQDQFVMVAQGGQSFEVQGGQEFVVSGVELAA